MLLIWAAVGATVVVVASGSPARVLFRPDDRVNMPSFRLTPTSDDIDMPDFRLAPPDRRI